MVTPESPRPRATSSKSLALSRKNPEDYMLQYGITFRLNDLLVLSEAYSKLAKTDFNPKK